MDPEAARTEACEAAETDSPVVIWNNFGNPDPIFSAFATAHPDVELEALTIRPDDAVQRVITESSAGRDITPDVVYSGLDVLAPLAERDLIDSSIAWADLGVSDDLVEQSSVRAFEDGTGLVFNTNEYGPDDLPDTWEELIDAKWQGQVIVDPRGRPFDDFGLVWGEEKTLDYVQRFKDVVDPVVLQGGTAGILAVASGQTDLTTGGLTSSTLEQQSKGAPIDIKYLDIVSIGSVYLAVMKDTQHENAAACFVSWVATDGSKAVTDAEFKVKDFPPGFFGDDVEFSQVQTPDDAEFVENLGKQIGEIWTGP